MRLAVYQGPGASGDVAANLATIRRVASRAAAEGAGLVVFPELFVTGYNLGPRLRELAEPLSGPSLEAIGAAAADARIAILTGFCEREGARLFNSAVLIGRDGSLQAVHRKCHLFGAMEGELFTPGDALVTIELDGLRVGILICYDVEFPEAVRTHALAGVELVAVPTALMQPFEIVSRAVVPTRAYENQVFLAYANRTGSEGEQTYVGESRVVAPDGADLAVAGPGEEMIVAPIEIERLRASRAINTHLENRRVELYRSILEPPAQHEREGGQR
jgi:predicted amidohydrolase